MSGTFTWPQVVNGKTYTAADFSPFGYAKALPDLLGNFAAQLASSQTATIISQATAAASSAQTAAQQAQEAVAGVTTGSTENLVYPALARNLATASDVVDVFVYDTRLDSDGGAWTERCGGTSWWNETLNTATRGAKRAFPKVAIIVARQSSLTIYDALELDVAGAPRLWMAFGNTGHLRSVSIVSVFALNGCVFVSQNNGSTGLLAAICFSADISIRHDASGKATHPLGIGGRNTSVDYPARSGTGLASSVCNHVHARVLPGAPLDPVSGLPIPTVAVATAGGASIIHPDGRVANLTRASGYSRVHIAETGLISVSRTDFSETSFGPIPYASIADTSWYSGRYRSDGASTLPMLAGSGNGLRGLTDKHIGGAIGLTHTDTNTSSPLGGMVAYSTTEYATGWQPGDTRLAALCDGAVGAIAGATLYSNDGTTLDGIASTGGATVALSGGKIEATNTSGANGGISIALSLVIGQTYNIELSTERTVGTPTSLVISFGSTILVSEGFPAGEKRHLLQLTAKASSGSLVVRFGGSGQGVSDVLTIDNISITLAAADRSYRAQGLNVVGSLTRTAVNTGNDLAAWSNFWTDRYLEQPYNPNLDFGTGDFCFAFWFNTTDTEAGIIERRAYDGTNYTGSGIDVILTAGQLRTNTYSSGTTAAGFAATTTSPSDGAWHLGLVCRRGNVLEVWVDGLKAGTGSSSVDLTNTSAKLRLGLRMNGAAVFGPGSIALLRISAYAPTPAQIAKMYADERPLFDIGAKAFLGGTSNTVNDLSFSEASRQLAVATNDGVSVFSGLRRVEYLDAANTSPAIASDTMRAVSMEAGMIAFGTAANAGVRRDAITGLDRMPAAPVRLSTRRRMRAAGVTTDATPLALAPRVHIGERETVIIEATIVGRVYGAADSERLSYVRRGVYYRDAGGNVTLQGSVQTIGTDTETTSGADATLTIDTTAQTVAVQVTGVASTRIVWDATFRVTRISEGTQYEETV